MSLYCLEKKNSIQQIIAFPFQLEREIQNLVESNLELLLNLRFIRSEFSISGSIQQLRIDTLAFDVTNKAFVIIEYKQDRNFSVVDQGYAYLAAMLNSKADFILEYNENSKDILRKSDVDWSQSRVIFISQAFTSYQKEAINFKDLPISLWEIRRYNNETISFEKVCKLNATESIKTISIADQTVNNVNNAIVVYTEDNHLVNAKENIINLYNQLKDAILEFDNAELKVTKSYISFSVDGGNFVDIYLQKKGLKIWINLPKGQLDDPYKVARDVSKVGHLGNGDYEIQVSSPEKLDYITTLVKQAYKQRA